MMSKRSKRELAEELQTRYMRSTKKEKTRILDEFVTTTGYSRKYANKLLKHGVSRKQKKKAGRKKKYYGEVVEALEQVWEICDRICSKRLHPFLPEIVEVLERFREIELSNETKILLLSMSRATIDRCLKAARYEHKKGLSTTKPGTLLKKSIEVRTWQDWDDEQPGFMEIDLVAHCGDTVAGQYLFTLTAVDMSTGWTECLALPNKTQWAVHEAIQEMRKRLPFPLLGIDSDNGSEFINDLLYRYCLEEKITFTRSRPYQKNDQAHVEQKNWSVVRHTVGYDRFETEEELCLLKKVYEDLRLYINFFQPVMKLVGKQRIDGKTIKYYDKAITPYRRTLAADPVTFSDKVSLTNLYSQLNPVVLRKMIDSNIGKLWKILK
ncbi:MAG: DDE-type integrase/transposase/recombinase [Anaerolineaceae bacterium]|nr:DDE-type integrase/transposase/recombinase [Anaerolineaceae bacterium]